MIASNDYLHEKELKRGEFCTSVDAFVYALDERSERWLIPIEWKYTETKHSIYFQEPFYQLMRQTLWAECICRNKGEKVLPAEHFVHIHVCPKDNRGLLNISRTLQLLTRQILAMRILHTFCGVFRVFSFVYVPDDK